MPAPPSDDRSTTKKIVSWMKKGLGEFCGIQDDEEEADKWKDRASKMGKSFIVNAKTRLPGIPADRAMEETDDVVDGLLSRKKALPTKGHYHPTDAIHTDKYSRRLDPRIKGPRKKTEKPLLFTMAYQAARNALMPPKKSLEYHAKSTRRSFAPHDLAKYGTPSPMLHVPPDTGEGGEDDVDAASFSVLDDMFFGSGFGSSKVESDREPLIGEDDVDTAIRHRPQEMVRPDKFREYTQHYRWVNKGGWNFREPVSQEAIREQQEKHRRAQQGEKVEPGYMSKLMNQMKNYVFDNSDRFDTPKNRVLLWCEKGLFAKCFNLELDRYYKYQWQGDQFVPDKSNDHRPGFTMWLTFIQIIIFLTSLAVYGVAPWGYDEQEVVDLVSMPNLALEKKSYMERENLWLGPRQADLVHLGAKYSPCIRRDANIEIALAEDRRRERQTACCINSDGSGCVQLPKQSCSSSLSKWYEFGDGRPGSVCGQDPKFCTSPLSLAPHEWDDQDFTQWPVCVATRNLEGKAHPDDPHMTCDIAGRPCCFGIQGECLITTRDYCTFLRGYFHEEANLCSQVDCMNEVCGMLPFNKKGHPDQFYRFWISLFLHAGVLHMLLTLFFNFLILWPMERLAGFMRVSVIYLMSGMAGSLASAIFLPYHVEAGPAGAQFGIVACHLVTIALFMTKPKGPILKMMGFVIFWLLLGLIPMIDNYAHVFGFIFGFLISFAILPFARFKKGNVNERTQRLIAIILCSVLVLGVATLLIILFYVAPIYHCPYCHYFTCIPFTPTFCKTTEVTIRNSSTHHH